MINLDKMKNNIGSDLFNYISKLSKVELENQLKAINADIEYLNNYAGTHTKTEFLPLRQAEKSLLEYRLQ